ncbi:putative nuclease with TOPRIM domain [Peptoniphilus olsenii]|uniref:Nuclease with TOPRIM domain n=1 Tax=Peptoniphilus olsenii TaxID=411570 RepID=A0ABV2JAC1_9FIRM
MDERECDLYRQHLKEKIERNETRINNHSTRIDKLEQYRSGTEQQIKNLVDQVQNLVTTMRWFIGLLIGSFVSFFFYAVQNGVIK